MADRVVFITYFLLISSLCLVHDGKWREKLRVFYVHVRWVRDYFVATPTCPSVVVAEKDNGQVGALGRDK